jgi:EPS-associated MarR family transcriptional regulator
MAPSDPKEDARFRILHLIEQEPALSQRQLAERLGISLGAVNYLVKAMTQRGFVTLKTFKRSDRKLAYAYSLTPEGALEKGRLISRFMKRKLAEYQALKHELEELGECYGVDPGEGL